MSKLNMVVQSLQQEMHEYLSGGGVYEKFASTSGGAERAKLKAFYSRVKDDLLALLQLALSQSTKAEGDLQALSLKARRGKKRAATAKTCSVGKKRGGSSLRIKGSCKIEQEDDAEVHEVRIDSLRSEPTGPIEQQHEGSVDRLLLKPPERGDDEGTEDAVEQKKRSKRAEKWTDQETNVLLEEFVKKPKSGGRFDRVLTLWTLMSEELQRQGYQRTGDQCRERMDTLKKSYTTISNYCDKHNKEFSQLGEDDYQNMKPVKPATRLKEKWYILIRDRCPPKSKSKKRIAKQGAENLPGFSRDINATSGSPSAGFMGASSSTSTLPDDQATPVFELGRTSKLSVTISCIQWLEIKIEGWGRDEFGFSHIHFE